MAEQAFGVDIGGSGIKGAPVDLDRGELTTERHRIPTPKTGPTDVLETVEAIVDHFGWDGPIGVAVPGVVLRGVVRSAVNLEGDWTDLHASERLQDHLGQPVAVINDADAAGIAEARYGAGQDVEGLVLVLTFGTGIGSALINDGMLVPNTEFGHLYIHGEETEQYAAARLVEEEGMELEKWARRANEVIEHFDYIFSPELIIFGGGISSEFASFRRHLTVSTPIVPAELRNGAGIVGAAMASRTGDQ